MILEAVFNMLFALIKALFSWINLPDMPNMVVSLLDFIKNTIISSCGILQCFCTPNYFKACLVFLIAIMNFDHLYKFTMFVLRKIPFLGIK